MLDLSLCSINCHTVVCPHLLLLRAPVIVAFDFRSLPARLTITLGHVMSLMGVLNLRHPHDYLSQGGTSKRFHNQIKTQPQHSNKFLCPLFLGSEPLESEKSHVMFLHRHILLLQCLEHHLLLTLNS